MTDTKTKCFVDCEDIKENTAKFNFEDNTLKLGKVSLSNQQLKRIGLMFATDLKTLPKPMATFLTLQQMQSTLICNPINKTKREEALKTSSLFLTNIYKFFSYML